MEPSMQRILDEIHANRTDVAELRTAPAEEFKSVKETLQVIPVLEREVERERK